MMWGSKIRSPVELEIWDVWNFPARIERTAECVQPWSETKSQQLKELHAFFVFAPDLPQSKDQDVRLIYVSVLAFSVDVSGWCDWRYVQGIHGTSSTPLSPWIGNVVRKMDGWSKNISYCCFSIIRAEFVQTNWMLTNKHSDTTVLKWLSYVK